MSYIGNTPAENYASFLTETFSVSATANYTLSHAVTNENEIRLVINGVVQQPGSGKAYTASGTTLTLTSATVSGDVMYAVYLGRALQTVNPPNASVGTAQLADSSVTSAKLASGAVSNTPSFNVYQNAAIGTTLTQNTATKVVFDSEDYDTDNAFSSGRFTVPSGEAGKYFFTSSITMRDALAEINIYLYKNGSNFLRGGAINSNIGSTQTVTGAIDLSVGDYVEVFVVQNQSTNRVEGVTSSRRHSYFHGYKLL